jgi:hypothetical protein
MCLHCGAALLNMACHNTYCWLNASWSRCELMQLLYIYTFLAAFAGTCNGLGEKGENFCRRDWSLCWAQIALKV